MTQLQQYLLIATDVNTHYERYQTQSPVITKSKIPFKATYVRCSVYKRAIGGYTKIVENLLDGIDVRLNTDYLEHKWFEFGKDEELADKATCVIFGGRLDEYKYYDMDTTITSVLDMCERELG